MVTLAIGQPPGPVEPIEDSLDGRIDIPFICKHIFGGQGGFPPLTPLPPCGLCFGLEHKGLVS